MRSSLAFVLVGCLVAMQARSQPAAAAPMLDARYRVQTMGVDLGQAELRLNPAGDGLTTELTFDTEALLGWSRHPARRCPARPNRVAARSVRIGSTVPIARKTGSARSTWAMAAKVPSTASSSPSGTRSGLTVPAGLPPGTVDPLAAFLHARAWLDQAPEGAELALSVFDGRKRYDANLRYLGLVQLSDDSGSAPAHRVAVRYTMVQALNEDTGVLETEHGRRSRARARGQRRRSLPAVAPGGLAGRPADLGDTFRRLYSARRLPLNASRPGQAAALTGTPFSLSSCSARRPGTSRARCRSRRPARP